MRPSVADLIKGRVMGRKAAMQHVERCLVRPDTDARPLVFFVHNDGLQFARNVGLMQLKIHMVIK